MASGVTLNRWLLAGAARTRPAAPGDHPGGWPATAFGCGTRCKIDVTALASGTWRKPAGMGTVSMARFCAVGGSQEISAVSTTGWPGAARTTTRTGRYVPGLTQMVSEIDAFGGLVSLIAAIPSTRCRPATVRLLQETAARRAPATVTGSERGAKPAPSSPS